MINLTPIRFGTPEYCCNLPPAIETAPVEMQAELLTLQTLSADKLRQIAQSQIPREQQERHILLLERNQEDLLTAEERRELRQSLWWAGSI